MTISHITNGKPYEFYKIANNYTICCLILRLFTHKSLQLYTIGTKNIFLMSLREEPVLDTNAGKQLS